MPFYRSNWPQDSDSEEEIDEDSDDDDNEDADNDNDADDEVMRGIDEEDGNMSAMDIDEGIAAGKGQNTESAEIGLTMFDGPIVMR